MVEFAMRDLPNYNPAWGCGYYELTGTRHLRCNLKVVVKCKVKNNRTVHGINFIIHVLLYSIYNDRIIHTKLGT